MNEKEEMELEKDSLGIEETIEVSTDSEALQEEQDRLENALRRAQADLVNYRNRMDIERADLLKYGNQRLLGRLLPILDDLDMALQQPAEDSSSESWLEGFQLINRKLHSLLEMEGVEQIEALDKPFDPAEHEALAQQQTADKEDGHVLLVVRNGYRLHDRVLRPAQVVVALNDDSPPAEPDAEPASDN